MPSPLKFLDLFCGCGGFSLGMERAGWQSVGAADLDPAAIKVFKTNLAAGEHAYERDLTTLRPSEMADLTGAREIDAIVGGPPCQGFSHVRQRDGSNNGPRQVVDRRRYLYRQFLEYVNYFRPKVFAMENVLGIKTASGGEYYRRVQEEARSLGYRVHGKIVEAPEYGVPQKRHRQLIFGTRADMPEFFRDSFMPPTHTGEKGTDRNGLLPYVTLGEAIGDLPCIRPGGGDHFMEYCKVLRAKHLAKYGRRYLCDVLEVDEGDGVLTAHKARPHSERDLGDFRKLREGENSAQAMRAGVVFDHPYDTENFQDRYTRQHRDRLCSTILAHLSKDGLMFIHPTQTRSLTPREAARIQSFPDWFDFDVTQTHQFRLIGNAVPPLVGAAVGRALRAYLETPTAQSGQYDDILPRTIPQAAKQVVRLIDAVEKREIQAMPPSEFRRGWFSVGFIYGGLHPNSVHENGKEKEEHLCPVDERIIDVDRRLALPFFRQSGWPVAVVPVVTEAWRRFRSDELQEREFYCAEAVRAGSKYRHQVQLAWT